MSNLEIHPVFLVNKGQVLDAPEEFLIDQVSPFSRNMEYFNELVQGRSGIAKFDTAVLSGNILEQFRFVKANADAFEMFFTPKHIYKYDHTNTRFDILNLTYTTGTITIDGGSLDTVTGSGTSWDTELSAGDYIKIGAGGIHTDSTWYEIDSVDSATQLTLTGNAVATGAGASYVAVKIFTGGNTNFWSITKFTDTNLGDIAVATNGVDTPVYWTGSSQCVFITGLPDTMKARYVTAYKDRLIFAWTVEGGANQPERVRPSDVANAVSYTTLIFEDLIDDGSGITGIIHFGDYIILTKEKVFYVGRWIGGDPVFDYEQVTGPVGCKSNRSLVIDKEWLNYYGYDKKFHRWNLVEDEIISEEIFPETKNFDPNLEQYIKGFNFYFKNQIRWFCPYSSSDYNNYIAVFDYKARIMQVWNCSQEQALLSMGFYLLQSDLYLDDATWGEFYLDEQEGYWDDFSFVSAAPVFIYGGYDGYVRIADTGSDDDGSAFTRTLRFKKLNFKRPHRKKRLYKQQYWIEHRASSQISVAFHLDDNESSHPTSHTISIDDDSKEIVKKTITVNLEAQAFRPEITATNFFALLGFLNFVLPKKRSY